MANMQPLPRYSWGHRPARLIPTRPVQIAVLLFRCQRELQVRTQTRDGALISFRRVALTIGQETVQNTRFVRSECVQAAVRHGDAEIQGLCLHNAQHTQPRPNPAAMAM